MFNDPKKLAKSALELLQLASRPGLTPSAIAALELGAATLCNHVFDWHDEAGKPPTVRQPPGKQSKLELAQVKFKHTFPDWDLLRQISNGTKHALSSIANPSNTDLREVEWEDYDFWGADHHRPTLFVSIGGKPRAVSALIVNFANSYIETA